MTRRSLLYIALLAPAATFAEVLKRTDGPDLPPANPVPSGWAYTGCFSDSPSNRILNDAHMQDDSGLTGASCMAFCASNGYPYAGTEYSSECYCGLTAPTGPVTGCNMGCTGNSSEACGGPGTITVYDNPPLTPHIYPGDNCWTSQGCYTDSTSSRSLERRVSPSGPGVEACLTECQAEGFSWAGLEYGSECWCGNALASSAQLTTDGCDMTCQGQVDEFCGGAGSMNLYQIAPSCAVAPTTTTSCTTTTTSSTTTTTPTTTSTTTTATTPTTTSTTTTTTSTTSTTSTTTTTSTTSSTTTTTTTTKPSPTTTTTTTKSTSTTSTKTSCTTTLKTSTTTTKTTSAPTCRPTIPCGLITNGGFEGSASPWSGSGGGCSGYRCGQTGGYEGCGIYVISPSYSSNQRSWSITSSANITPNAAHQLVFYVGRRTGSVAPASNPTITCSVGGTSWSTSVAACSGSSCNLPGANGTVWKKVTASVPAFKGTKNAPLVITVTWPNGGRCNSKGYGEDDLLIDGISVN